jgi:hypothetical protein
MSGTNPTVQIVPIQNWPYWLAISVTAPSGTKMQAVQNFVLLDAQSNNYTANAQFRQETAGYSFWLYIGDAAAAANDAGKPVYAGVLGNIVGGITFESPLVTIPGHGWGNTAEQPAARNPEDAAVKI